jgi:hypothetical protein
MPWVRFEPTIAACERTKTVFASDRAITVIGQYRITCVIEHTHSKARLRFCARLKIVCYLEITWSGLNMSNPQERHKNFLGVIIFAPAKELCEVGHIAYTITECVASHLTWLLFKTNPIKYISRFCVVESYEIFLLYSSAFVKEFFIPPYLITSNKKWLHIYTELH